VFPSSRPRERFELRAARREAHAPSQEIDGLVPGGADEPCARVAGRAVGGPPLERGRERLLHHLLGEIEIAEEADERGEHAGDSSRKDARDRVAAHMAWMGRTSTHPERTAGSRLATSIASSRFFTSMQVEARQLFLRLGEGPVRRQGLAVALAHGGCGRGRLEPLGGDHLIVRAQRLGDRRVLLVGGHAFFGVRFAYAASLP
jgi:hypothetical protein